MSEPLPGAPARLLVAFQDAVSCESLRAGACWRLRGLTRARSALEPSLPSLPAELLLSGTRIISDGPALPSQLHELLVRTMPGTAETAAPAGPAEEPAAAACTCELRLEAREGIWTLRAQGVRVHRDVSQALFAALPPAQVPPGTRAAWALLLWLLRSPPLSKLLIGSTG